MIKFEHYKKKIKFKKIITDLILIYILAIIFVLIFNSFLFQAFKIPSNSMEPQIKENSLILVNKFIIGFKYPFSDVRIFNGTDNIKRGDIVVFMSHDYIKKNKFLRDMSSIAYILSFTLIDFFNLDRTNSNIYIKRVIGLPGDVIRYTIENDKMIVLINNIPEKKIINKNYQLIEETSNNSLLLDKTIYKNEYIVGKNEFYVLGDNRISSLDSRIWHGVKSKQIIGKAILKYYPKIEVIK